MKQFTGTIISNTSISSDFFEMEFTWDASAGLPLPGQFFTARVSEGTAPLLRRPFALSAFDEKDGLAVMMYQSRGRATALLAGKGEGELLHVLGPLGRPFPLPEPGRKALLVAGGAGIGPLVFLAEALRRRQRAMTLIIGFRTGSNVPFCNRLSQLQPIVCTDDGSMGHKGTAGDYLKSIGGTVDAATVLYGCGPNAMLKTCHELSLLRDIECYVSVEQVMACGVGACMGCAVKDSRGGYLRTCTEGPVFSSREINWR